MKSKIYKSSLTKLSVFGLWVVAFSLSVTTQTHAQNESAGTMLTKPAIALVSNGKKNASRNMIAPERKAQLLRMLARTARLNPKALKLATGCGCVLAAPDDGTLSGFASCMRGCLQDAGASYFAIIMCAGSCAFGVVPVCALCVGLTVAAVEACALGCAAYPGPYPFYYASHSKRRQASSRSLQARLLRLQAAKGKV